MTPQTVTRRRGDRTAADRHTHVRRSGGRLNTIGPTHAKRGAIGQHKACRMGAAHQAGCGREYVHRSCKAVWAIETAGTPQKDSRRGRRAGLDLEGAEMTAAGWAGRRYVQRRTQMGIAPRTRRAVRFTMALSSGKRCRRWVVGGEERGAGPWRLLSIRTRAWQSARDWLGRR